MSAFKLQRLNPERAQILDGNRVAGILVWTDSLWMLDGLPHGGPIAFQNCNEVDDLDLAFTQSFEYLTARDASLDFLLDPPTFVGPTDGERACWIYVVWKLTIQNKSRARRPANLAEWSDKDFSASQAIYRQVRRKYGDSPPDKENEVVAAQAYARTGIQI